MPEITKDTPEKKGEVKDTEIAKDTGGETSRLQLDETEREGDGVDFDDRDDSDGISEGEASDGEETDEDDEESLDSEDSSDRIKDGDEKKPTLSAEQIERVKANIRADIEFNKNIKSGYKAYSENDKTYQNRNTCKLSNKNFDQLMKARGLDPKTSEELRKSFKGEMTLSRGYVGDKYNMVYGEKKASGNFLAGSEARGMTPDQRKADYALPPGNSAKHVRQVQLAKDQFIISGVVSEQKGFTEDARDGVERKGGAKQFVTDGGYKGGAVKDAYTTIADVKTSMSEKERQHYEKTDTVVGEVNGREALIRNDIDYDQVDSKGRTNLQRMEAGLAPKDKDGKSIELHHMGQKMDAPIAELKRDEHRGKGVDAILHDKNAETDINRTDFNKERQEYWKARAKQIREQRGDAG